jgi:hypothetical protein
MAALKNLPEKLSPEDAMMSFWLARFCRKMPVAPVRWRHVSEAFAGFKPIASIFIYCTGLAKFR